MLLKLLNKKQIARKTSFTKPLLALSLIICIFLASMHPVYAKTSNEHFTVVLPVTGVVHDENGQPLSGVSVVVRGTANGTSTDASGKFTINANAGDVIEFSIVGHKNVTVTVGTNLDLSVTMPVEAAMGTDVVVVGYGTQRRSQLIGSVSQITAKDVNNRPVTQLSQAITGQMPGVTVIQRSGQPGVGGSIQVRGVGSFGATPSALILVDGIPTNSFNDIDPNDVESISVLKDASSAAIYGARAANGVILVTTKSGSSGKLKITYNGYVGSQRLTATPDFVNSWEYAALLNEAQPNSYTAAQIQLFRDGSDPDNYPNVNYAKEMFKQGTIQTGHNLTLSNGTANTQYLLSFGYLYQNGIVAKNNFNRYNTRLNLTTNISPSLKLTTRLSAIQNRDEQPAEPATLDINGMSGLISQLVRYPAIYPIRLSNGYWGTGVVNKGNPVSFLQSESFYNNRGVDLGANARLDWNIIPDLKLSAIGGYTQGQGQDKTFIATQRINANIFLGPSSLTQSSSYSDYKTFQGLADYKKTFNNHELSILGGYSFEEFYNEGLSAGRSDLPSNSLTSLGLGDPSTQVNGSSASEYALESVFGRIQYNYKRKYLAEGVMRYDGSSRFPSELKYATFPAIALGWRLSEEKFIKDRFDWLDEFKLKASYGILGNQNIGNYPYQNLLPTGYNYPFGGMISPGAARASITDTTLHWESTRTKDIGIEASVFRRKLSFSAVYFDRYTYDILSSPSGSVSWILGFNVGQQNSGKLTNKGWEFTVEHQNNIGAFNYSASANLSIIDNVIVDLGVGNINQPNGLTGNPNIGFIGYPLNMYYGYVADGLFTDAADVTAWKANNNMTEINANPQPGDIRYRDISGPGGKPDGKVTAAYDRVVLGTNIPEYTYGFRLGFSYKGFDFNSLFQGVAGVKGYLDNYAGWAFYQNGNVQRWQMEERWTAANPDRDAKYPRMEVISNQGTPNTLTSSYWLLNGSYLRIKNLQVGYTVPKNWLQRTGIDGVRINIGGENLHTWSNYRKGWDPEVNTGGSYYPILRNYTVGLNVNF